MSGKRAKKIRKYVYGNELSSQYRTYQQNNVTKVILADMKRHDYQEAKKAWNARTFQ